MNTKGFWKFKLLKLKLKFANDKGNNMRSSIDIQISKHQTIAMQVGQFLLCDLN